jgi:hypothetical protein
MNARIGKYYKNTGMLNDGGTCVAYHFDKEGRLWLTLKRDRDGSTWKTLRSHVYEIG